MMRPSRLQPRKNRLRSPPTTSPPKSPPTKSRPKSPRTTTWSRPATEAEGDVDTEVEEATDVAQQGGELISVGMETEIVGMRPTEDTCGSACYNMLNTDLRQADGVDRRRRRRRDGCSNDITPNEDFTVWTANLKEGITFHDGTPLTAQTIADMFPIQQTGSQSAGQISASGLAGVEATGEFEITYTLSQFQLGVPGVPLACAARLRVRPRQGADLDAWNAAPNGTGPFHVREPRPRQRDDRRAQPELLARGPERRAAAVPRQAVVPADPR